MTFGVWKFFKEGFILLEILKKRPERVRKGRPPFIDRQA